MEGCRKDSSKGGTAMRESYICGNNLLEIIDENGILTAETFFNCDKTHHENEKAVAEEERLS